MKSIVYLINLDGSAQRLASASSQLRHAGIDFIRVPAVDGRGRLFSDFPDVDPSRMRVYLGRDLSGGEVGCYLSHMRCAQMFLESDADHAIVIEDDFLLGRHNFETVLREVLPSLPPTWHVINFGNEKNKIFSRVHELCEGQNRVRLVKAHYFPMTTTGLCWSRAGARAFLDSGLPIFASVDRYLRHWQTRMGKGYCFMPPLVTTTGASSDISRPSKTSGMNLVEKAAYGYKKQAEMVKDKTWAYARKIVG